MTGARRASPEAQIQRAVFQHFHVRGAPGVFVFHPANGGYRKPIEAKILKGLGVVAGVPGATATHTHGLDQAIRVLESWGLLRGRSS